MGRRDVFHGFKRIDALHRLALVAPPLTGPLRLASYAAYRGMEIALGERHPHERVIAQAAALQRDFHPPAVDGPKVLFFTVRGWFTHVAVESLLAKALQLRGARPAFFLCGGQLPQCDFKPASDPYVTRPLCWRCFGFGRRLLQSFGLPFSDLRTIVDSECLERAHRAISGLNRRELEAFSYRGMPLYDFALPSIQRSLLRGDPGEGVHADRVASGMVESGVVFVDACEALLDRERPDRIVATNGLFIAERILLELARRRGIPVVTYEIGLVRKSLLFDHDRPVAVFDMDPIWAQFRDVPLTPDEDRKLDTYLAARTRGEEGQDLWPKMDSDWQELLRRFQLDPDRPVIVLYTNILWDSALFKSDVGFNGMMDWILTTIRWFARRPDLQLIIRVHPSEVQLPMFESRDRVADQIPLEFPALPPNVRLIDASDAADSYLLMRKSRAVLVYSSTIGVEAAVAGKPVVVAGETHYRRRGFTLDLDNAGQMDAVLSRAIDEGAIASGLRSAARRYAYAFFFRFMHPFPWVTDEPRGARRLELSALSELAPGADEGLDRICEGILRGAPFVAPPAAPVPAGEVVAGR